VTYGAGGSTRERTHATVERILKETSLTPAAHLDLRRRQRARVDEVARDIGTSAFAHRRASRRSAEPGRNTSRIPKAIATLRARRRPEEGRAVRHLGGCPIRKSILTLATAPSTSKI
jgi:hypothetical protein